MLQKTIVSSTVNLTFGWVSHHCSSLYKLSQEALLLKNVQRMVKNLKVLTRFNRFQGNMDVGQRNFRCFHRTVLLLE